MKKILLPAVGLLIGSLSLHAQTFTGGAGMYDSVHYDYGTAGNWSGDSVPFPVNGTSAVIGPGYNVTYNASGDLYIENGGVLQIDSGGAFTQIGGNNYIQLSNGGGVVVNGGTFDQGTSSSSEFQLTGTGNYFTITSGAANFNQRWFVNPGFTYTQSGGTVTLGSEFDYDNTADTISGGILNATLLTGANATGAGILTFSGGIINITGTGYNGIYPQDTTEQYVNFTPGSTGVLNFAPGVTLSAVQNFITNGDLQYNNTIDPTDLVATNEGAFISVSVEGADVPEPSTWAMLAIGLLFLVQGVRRFTAEPAGR